MTMFMYWCRSKDGGKRHNFRSTNFYEEGTVIQDAFGESFVIVDFDVEDTFVSCAELCEYREEGYYV